MTYPDFITDFPSLDVPFPEDVVQTAVIRSDAGLVAFFTFLKDFELPPHSHKAQWGTVVEGEIELTIGGETRTYRPGDSYSIPAGIEMFRTRPSAMVISRRAPVIESSNAISTR